MKLSPLTQMKVGSVLGAAFLLLGCNGSVGNAGEQTAVLQPLALAEPDTAPAPNLVTVTNLATDLSTNAPAPPNLSERLQEIVKLAESGVGDDVLLAYIQNSQEAFNPTPDEILYLTDLGISDVVITALVNHTYAEAASATAPPAAVANAPPVVAQPAPTATYNPEPQVVEGAAPTVLTPAQPTFIE